MPGKFLFRSAGAGELIAVAGDLYTVLASGEETGGAYALFDATVPPGGGPPFHIHTREDEAFVILEGEITVFTKDQEVTAGPGAFIHAPRGSAHRFENRSDKPARLLIQVTPAGIENYFRVAGYPVTNRELLPDSKSPEAIGRLLAHAAEFGIEILPPAE